MSATQRDHRLHAVDAFLDLVPSGRILAGDVASVMARYAEAWPANRWAEIRIRRPRSGRARPVVDLLTALLPQLHHGPPRIEQCSICCATRRCARDGRSLTPYSSNGSVGLKGSSAAAKMTAGRCLGRLAVVATTADEQSYTMFARLP